MSARWKWTLRAPIARARAAASATMRSRDVDARHRPRRADRRGGGERADSRAGRQIQHALARAQLRPLDTLLRQPFDLRHPAPVVRLGRRRPSRSAAPAETPARPWSRLHVASPCVLAMRTLCTRSMVGDRLASIGLNRSAVSTTRRTSASGAALVMRMSNVIRCQPGGDAVRDARAARARPARRPRPPRRRRWRRPGARPTSGSRPRHSRRPPRASCARDGARSRRRRPAPAHR